MFDTWTYTYKEKMRLRRLRNRTPIEINLFIGICLTCLTLLGGARQSELHSILPYIGLKVKGRV